MNNGNIYNKIETTEWDFYLDGSQNEENKIRLYTLPAITAKLKWQLNKLYKPAFEKQMLQKMNSKQFADLMVQNGINLQDITGDSNTERQKDIIGNFMPMILEIMQNEPLDELHNDWDKAIEFCLLCVDKQKILQENSDKENSGRENLNKILDVGYWEFQKPELVEMIINQYSFRNNETNSIH